MTPQAGMLLVAAFVALVPARLLALPSPFLTVTVAPPLALASGPDGLSIEPVTVAEVTTEFDLRRPYSLGAIVGFGGADQVRQLPRATVTQRVHVLAIGVQGARYLLGGFDNGVKVGAELLTHTAWTGSGSIRGSGFAMQAGAFAGAKGVVGRGFTGEIDLGVQIERRAATETIGTASDSSVVVQVAPLLNVQVGWTF